MLVVWVEGVVSACLIPIGLLRSVSQAISAVSRARISVASRWVRKDRLGRCAIDRWPGRAVPLGARLAAVGRIVRLPVIVRGLDALAQICVWVGGLSNVLEVGLRGKLGVGLLGSELYNKGTNDLPVAVLRYLIFYSFCIPRVAENLGYTETRKTQLVKNSHCLLGK